MINNMILADCFQEMLDDYIFHFLEHEQEAITGQRHIFDEVYLPLLREQGVSAINLAVGGERATQVMYSDTDVLRFWDAHKKLDILNSELEAGCQSFVLCRTGADIDEALSQHKILVFATLAGGRPLEGKPNLNLLSSLRSLYRMGLRGLQLTGNGRNRLGDGVAQNCTKGKLTGFGSQVVQECNRLGILLDTAQLSDYGFYDLVSLTENPVIDSHSCAAQISVHPRNLSRQRIEAIAKTGGIVGVSIRSALVAAEKEGAVLEDLLRQIDYMVETAGVDHVALGPDYSSFQTPVDRSVVVGFGNWGPDVGPMDYLTPMQSEKKPGWIDGIWYGTPKNDFVAEVSARKDFREIPAALLRRGYSEEDCRKICGKNLLRVYREVLK